MWPRLSLRRIGIPGFRRIEYDRSGSSRRRRRPRLEVLEDRQLLAGLPTYHFDFGPSGSPVAAGYTGVGTAAFSATTGYGWQSSSGIYADSNWWPNYNDVTASLVYSSNDTFLANVPDGTYTVVPTLGRYSASESQVAISLDGQQVASGLATASEQFVSPAYQVTVTTGQLAVNLQVPVGSYFLLDALSILPGQVQPPTTSAGPAITAVAGSPVTFSQATASGTGALSYNWYFGDSTSTSSTSTVLHPTYTYTTPGTYTALLTVTDANGLVVGSPVSVTVASGKVTANAGPNQTVNEESPMTFAGSVTGGTAPYVDAWNFGDGTSATGSLTPTHTYTTPGSYTATLTVTDATGASSSSSLVATVKDVAPTVNIGGPYQGKPQVSVGFSATATDVNPAVQSRLTESWNFGDGTTATGLTPSHVFAQDGAYNVSLTVTDPYGGSTTATTVVDIFPSVTVAPVSAINAGASASLVGTVVGASSPLTYGWNFGDGTTASGTLTPTHLYANPGSYSATLTVTDSAGLSSSSATAVTVNDVAPTVSVPAPSAADATKAVSFKATATDISPAVQAAGFTYSWSFGDGGTGTGASPSHTFASAGSYTVKVTATDEYGKTGTASETITVSVPPTISAGSALTVNAGSSLAFSQATESGGAAPLTYAWAFGDGTSQSGSLNPSHTYANPGSDTATVTVTDGNGVSSSSSVAVTVNDVPPTVTLTAPSTGTTGSAVSFAAVASDISPADQAAGFTYSWNFGDGGTASGADPTHTYTSSGTYTAKVTATDEYGKTGTATASIVVSSSSTLTVSAGSNETINAGSTATFVGSVSGGTAPYAYSWNFGDGSTFSGNTGSIFQTDTTTQGNWVGTYGAVGYNVIGDSSSYPSYAVVTASGQSETTYASSTTEPVALQSPENPSNRVAAVWYSATSFQVGVDLTDGNSRQVSLYVYDWYDQGFSEQINVLNATTGTVLNSQTVSNFSAGEYLTWNVSGNVTFKITMLTGGDAVMSGLFIGNATTSGGTDLLNASHVYLNPGTYTAALTAADSAGHNGSSSATVTVNDVAPTVSLSAPSTSTVGTPNSFTAIATDISPADEAAGFTYSWNFGDGSTASGDSPTHWFTSAGTYTVTATATDEYGMVGKASGTIVISGTSGSLVVSAGTNVTTSAGSTLTFAGSVSGGVAPYTESWILGDGNGAFGALNPTHVYEAGGSYTAILTVTDSKNDTSSSSIVVTVKNVAPTASISVPATGTAGVPVSFSASATDPSAVDQVAGFTYAWNFGDGTTGSGVTPVHVYSTAGTYTVSVTATDEDKLTSSQAVGTTVVSAPSGGSTVNITSAWLTQQGSAPYVLSQANTNYVLQTNVTTSGTAFVVLAQNVTLNLNGYTVTYGNSAPATVTNGGFESGSGTNVPGWNIAGAPAAALAPNTNYLFGNQVLRLTNFSTAQTIISNAIPISLIDHTYEATITPGNANVAYGTSVTINVIDSVTGHVLGTGTSANTQRGFSAIAAFTPTTTDPVELQVVVTPPSGVTTSVDLDAATLNVSYDYGIIASGQWSGSFPGSGAGYLNLPAPVQAAYSANSATMVSGANFDLENGSIVQGQGNGTDSSPLFFEYLGGLTVNKVTTSDTGVDTTNLDGTYAGGAISITNSTFRDNIPNVTDRMAGPATISFFNTTGNILIDGNQILGSPQFGIAVDTNNGYSLAIDDNYISQDAMVADAYAIDVNAISDFQIKGNTIDPTSGEGIDVDGYRAAGSSNGVIQNNIVTVQERPNRETEDNTYARALRLRNDVDSEGPQTNIDISGNTFIANCGIGYSQHAYAVWISYVNNNGAMNNANVNLHDNTIEGIVNTTDPSYDAYALVLDQVDAGINMTISNNVLESNDTSLSIGGYNDGNISGLTFLGNTLDISNAGPARTYTGILAGFDVTQISNVSILDTQLENGATANITWAGSGTKNIQVGAILNMDVENPNGSAASGATVRVYNGSGQLVYQGTTNSQGLLSNIPLVTTTYTQAGSNPAVITTSTSGPFTIKTTIGSQTTSIVVNATSQEALTVWMN